MLRSGKNVFTPNGGLNGRLGLRLGDQVCHRHLDKVRLEHGHEL